MMMVFWQWEMKVKNGLEISLQEAAEHIACKG